MLEDCFACEFSDLHLSGLTVYYWLYILACLESFSSLARVNLISLKSVFRIFVSEPTFIDSFIPFQE